MILVDKEWLGLDNDFLVFAAGLQIVGKYTTVKIMSLTLGVRTIRVRELMNKAGDMGLVEYEDGVYKINKINPKNYVSISESDFEIIISKCKKCFKYFCWLMESRCMKTDHIITEPYKVGFMPREYFSKKMGVSLISISTYNAELEKAGVIYFKRYRNMTLVYGRPCDRDLVDKYAKYRLTLDKIQRK